MKRSILILTSALAIFVATLMITNEYMGNETMHEADIVNDLQIKEITRRMDINLLVREKAVHSFLSGIFYYDIHKRNASSSDTLIYISDKEMPRFKNYVYESLKDFIKLNPHTHCAAFLIDHSVYPDKGKTGFAPLIDQNDSTHKNIARRYDFRRSKPYQDALATGRCQWTIPPKDSPAHGKSILYYVPIRRQNGGVFGTFVINVDIDVLRAGFTEALPYGANNSLILTVDSEQNIIFSTNTVLEGFKRTSDYTTFLQKAGDYTVDAVDSAHHDVVSWHGEDFFVYRHDLTHAPWQIITVCNKKAIYDDVTTTRNVILIVSVIGMLLMLLCCIVVFLQVKKNLTERAAAEGEIKMAANVQKSLLRAPSYSTNHPSNPVSLDAFIRPAREAGGDLYDYVERDGKLLFCIGDVSGKGMAAALFMTQVVSLFRNAATFSDQPDLMVSQINNVIAMNNPEMTFCTFFIGVIDANSRTLTFCNAGHNRPIIVSGAEGENPAARFLTVKPNVAIGLMENYPYKAETILLDEGDSLLLYTDGVTEAKNAKHELFGDDNLLAAAKSPTTTTIAAAIDAFVNGYEQSDDITIVVVKSTKE